MNIREATTGDIEQLHVIRTSVYENKLSDPSRISYEDYKNYLTDYGKGWVCESGNRIAGFAIVAVKQCNVWALFILPEFQSQGIGKSLQTVMLDWYFSEQTGELWLSTAPGTRAERFYQSTGWTNSGLTAGGEVKFSMTREKWMRLSREGGAKQ